MSDWDLHVSKLKRYPHFDSWISSEDAIQLATDPQRVSTHTFYPFMRYVQGWTRFAGKSEKGKRKDRPIRYAARADAYIFAYYRHVLSERYEVQLKNECLADNVLAYRKIPNDSGLGGKCNIHFAKDAFLKIRELGDCCVLALDISNFFESLDHKRLYEMWLRLMGCKRLPHDHFQVFKAITRYSIVDKMLVYQRLGHFGKKRTSSTGVAIPGYLTPRSKMPLKLCTGEQFRQKIAGGDGTKSLIEKNFKPYGIPQGSPISDLLANVYLLDFDITVAKWTKSLGGTYYRYSDDILIILPGEKTVGLPLMDEIQTLIQTFGSKLKIKDEKTSFLEFHKCKNHQIFNLVKGTQGKNGLEYLGFRFDGKYVYIRDSTLSNLYRKISRNARRAANAMARRYSDKSLPHLIKAIDYERFTQRFGKVEDFGEKSDDYRNWTFWTYAKRAHVILGELGKPIIRQLRKLRSNIRTRLENELATAVAKR